MTRPTSASLLFIALTVLFTVVGQLLVKKGTLEVNTAALAGSQNSGFLWQALCNGKVLFGLGCAVVAALCWIVAVSRSDLSFAYPFTGLGTVLVLALSPMVLGEVVPWNRWLGVAIVCVGIVIASRS